MSARVDDAAFANGTCAQERARLEAERRRQEVRNIAPARAGSHGRGCSFSQEEEALEGARAEEESVAAEER